MTVEPNSVQTIHHRTRLRRRAVRGVGDVLSGRASCIADTRCSGWRSFVERARLQSCRKDAKKKLGFSPRGMLFVASEKRSRSEDPSPAQIERCEIDFAQDHTRMDYELRLTGSSTISSVSGFQYSRLPL